MKKMLSIAALLFLMFSNTTFAQSNITWIIRDKIEKGTLKTKLEFNSGYTGIKDAAQFLALYRQISASKDVASCINKGKAADGTYQLTFTMKQAHGKDYYANWAMQIGIGYIQIGGIRKSCAEVLAGKAGASKAR